MSGRVGCADSSTDLHLKAGSPAVDRGISLSPGLTDIDGQCRPVGQGWDIGADER